MLNETDHYAGAEAHDGNYTEPNKKLNKIPYVPYVKANFENTI